MELCSIMNLKFINKNIFSKCNVMCKSFLCKNIDNGVNTTMSSLAIYVSTRICPTEDWCREIKQIKKNN